VNLIDEAESLMLQQFKDSERHKGLVRSLIAPLQSAADVIYELSDGGYIQNASYHRLDMVGSLVGQSRSGLSDEDFRAWINIRDMLHRCSGTSEQLLAILKRLLEQGFPFTIQEHFPNDIFFLFFGRIEISPMTVFGLIRSASPVGLKHHFIRADVPKPFKFDVCSFSEVQFADFFKERPDERI
jgi:hypothetical protein